MDISLVDIIKLLDLGSAILIAVLAVASFYRLSTRVLNVVQSNTEAMERLRSMLSAHSASIERLAVTVDHIDKRLDSLEDSLIRGLLQNGGGK